jgi:glycosyltransferase involved in cell wall biosynthesis
VSRRIAIDASNFVRDRRGMGRLARPVLRAACDDDRFEVTLLADKPSDLRALRSEFEGVALRATGSARRPGRYDAVWFPFNGMRYSVAAPALVAINDAFAFTEPHRERIARMREQSPIRRAAREASRIVTISKWSRLEIARELGLPLERIDVIAPAPDPYWCPGSGDVLPDALEESRFALVVGAGEARKNVRLAIEACARAFERPDELLVIVGRLNDGDRAFARGLGVRAGEISASDPMLRALYRRASVVLVPSLAEGFGLVAVEALACGAPVLAADTSALPEATGGAATLLDPNDTAAWARAMRTLFDDESAAAAARARAVARFASLDRSAPGRRTLALIDEIAGRGA